jgi:hypothetical protein
MAYFIEDGCEELTVVGNSQNMPWGFAAMLFGNH